MAVSDNALREWEAYVGAQGLGSGIQDSLDLPDPLEALRERLQAEGGAGLSRLQEAGVSARQLVTLETLVGMLRRALPPMSDREHRRIMTSLSVLDAEGQGTTTMAAFLGAIGAPSALEDAETPHALWSRGGPSFCNRAVTDFNDEGGPSGSGALSSSPPGGTPLPKHLHRNLFAPPPPLPLAQRTLSRSASRLRAVPPPGDHHHNHPHYQHTIICCIATVIISGSLSILLFLLTIIIFFFFFFFFFLTFIIIITAVVAFIIVAIIMIISYLSRHCHGHRCHDASSSSSSSSSSS